MNLTKHIITNAILLWAFSPVSLANAIRFDDPKFVTLSSGQQVPFGVPGVICADDCVSVETLAMPDSSRRLWIVPITTILVLCAVLCRGSEPPPVVPARPDTPQPTPTPRREVPLRPAAPVPDRNTLELCGLGLVLCWGAFRLRTLHEK